MFGRRRRRGGGDTAKERRYRSRNDASPKPLLVRTFKGAVPLVAHSPPAFTISTPRRCNHAKPQLEGQKTCSEAVVPALTSFWLQEAQTRAQGTAGGARFARHSAVVQISSPSEI